MKLSIIIPVFNEEKTIAEVIKKVASVKLPNITREIIVVDDGSTDSTAKKVTEVVKKIKGIQFIKQPKNKGKGEAVRAGIKKSTGDYIIIQDADLEYSPSDIPKLIEPILKKTAEVVYGTRLRRWPNFNRDERSMRFLVHYMGNKSLSLITSLLYGQWITDMETGYKLFPRSAIGSIKLKARSFDLEPEITAKLLKKGHRIHEIPISTNPRGYKEGKKINTIKDGRIALWSLLKYRLVD